MDERFLGGCGTRRRTAGGYGFVDGGDALGHSVDAVVLTNGLSAAFAHFSRFLRIQQQGFDAVGQVLGIARFT